MKGETEGRLEHRMQSLSLEESARPDASLLSDDSLDPHKLILTADGVEKSFYEWTLEYADRYFPDLQKKVYRVPAVNFNIQGNSPKINVAGEHVTTMSEVNESNAKGDLATRVVCEALERLGHELGSLAIVANFQFENYLNRIVTATGFKLHKPQDKTNRGDLDILAMNLQSGAVLIEVKSVGYEIKDWDNNHKANLDRVRTWTQKAVAQVDKAKKVFDYIMDDLNPRPQVSKVVALPYVPRVIMGEIHADVMSTNDSDDVCFLCQDDLPSSVADAFGLRTVPVYKKTSTMVHEEPSKLRVWWNANITSKKQTLSDITLKSIMGRFCGLLSTVSVCSNTKARVEVRTKGEAVGETGRQFSAIVLTPDQLKIFQEKDDTAVGLRGPPGSGKTMLLALKGRQWVNQGHKIVVASVQSTGRGVPSGVSLQKLIEGGFKESTGTSILPVDLMEVPVSKTFDPQVFDDELAKLGYLSREHVHFLMDEFAYRDTAPQILHYLVHEKRVSVWWAMLHSSDMTQVEGYKNFCLDRAMRSPPSVQRLLKELEWNAEWRDSYTTRSEFGGLPTDGPPIACVRHARHAQPALLPIECQECAEEIADFLIHDLGVGVSLSAASPVSASYESSDDQTSTVYHQKMSSSGPDCKIGADDRKKKSKKKQRPKAVKGNFDTAIKFEDVILLFQIPMNMVIKEGDNLYRLVREKFQKFWDNLPSGPFMTEMRKLGLPVIPVLEPCDIALPSPGHIGVTISGLAWGLERTVVVVLATDIISDDTFQDPSVLDNVNDGSQSTSTKEESAEISHEEETSSCSISSENIISLEDQGITQETSSPATPPYNVPSICTEGNIDSTSRAKHLQTAGSPEQSSGTAQGFQTTELQNTKVPSANKEATSATATRCPNPCVHTATGTVTGGRTHKGVKQTTDPHFVCEDEIAATVEQGPSDLEAKELEKTGVCEEDDEKTLLELVRKLPTYHQQMLFVAASRSVSQLVLAIPTTWEK